MGVGVDGPDVGVAWADVGVGGTEVSVGAKVGATLVGGAVAAISAAPDG